MTLDEAIERTKRVAAEARKRAAFHRIGGMPGSETAAAPHDRDAAALDAVLAALAEARRERDAQRVLLKNCEYVFQVCWRDLKEWLQFARYNAEGILCGDKMPLPDPPQRPTVAGANFTDQNISVVEEMLTNIHRYLDTPAATPSASPPPP